MVVRYTDKYAPYPVESGGAVGGGVPNDDEGEMGQSSALKTRTNGRNSSKPHSKHRNSHQCQ